MKNKIFSKITAGILLCNLLIYTTPVLAFTKDETVYAKTDTQGQVYHTIVNSHLINEEKEDSIYDLSDLLNIENVNGNEELKQEGNQLIWKANGNDIYYQGESQKSLPVECKISYELNGKEISAKELNGKSGKVKITLTYLNKEEHIVKISGENQKLYTPFVTIMRNNSKK